MNPVQRFIHNTAINSHCVTTLQPIIEGIDNKVLDIQYHSKTTKEGFLHTLSFDNITFTFINQQTSIKFGRVEHNFEHPLQGVKIFTQFVLKGIPFNAENYLKNLSTI